MQSGDTIKKELIFEMNYKKCYLNIIAKIEINENKTTLNSISVVSPNNIYNLLSNIIKDKISDEIYSLIKNNPEGESSIC